MERMVRAYVGFAHTREVRRNWKGLCICVRDERAKLHGKRSSFRERRACWFYAHACEEAHMREGRKRVKCERGRTLFHFGVPFWSSGFFEVRFGVPLAPPGLLPPFSAGSARGFTRRSGRHSVSPQIATRRSKERGYC